MNRKPTGTRKRIYILSAAILLLGIAVFAWEQFKYRFAHEKIRQLVSTQSNGLYSLQYEGLNIDAAGGYLTVTNIRLQPDTALYRRLEREHKAPPVLVTISMKQLTITGVKTPKALLNKEISGGKLEINNPSIEIGVNRLLKDTSGYAPAREIYRQLLGQLKSIHVDSVNITNANLLVRDLETGKIIFTGKDVSLILSELAIDSLQQNDSSRILFSKNFDLLCREIVLPSNDEKYRFHFDGLEFISQSNSFRAQRIRVVPQLDEPAFARAFKVQKDRYDFDIEGIELLHINRPALRHKRLEADSLIIRKSSFKIYRDISYPHDSINRVGAYPQQQIAHVPFPLNIHTVIFLNSFIEYKEKNARSDSSGKVQFNKVNASLTHVSNMPGEISGNKICRLDFNALFLDQAPLKARLTMYLKDPQGRFSIEGNMGEMPGGRLNALLEPMALVKIENGNIQRLHFRFTGDNYHATGPLLVLYNGIKLSFLKKNESKNTFQKKTLSSFVANLLVKDSNPLPGSAVRQVQVDNKRDIHRSFFNLLWKSIFSGVKQSAGMK